MAGYPLINIKATLVDGSVHAVDSSQIAFEQAGRLALIDAAQKAGLTLLEPIMKVVITTPEDYFGFITGDVASRRGMIVNTKERGNTRLIPIPPVFRALEKPSLSESASEGSDRTREIHV